ncbi:hypothetical protein BX600DRAFT_556236 [Xylariales sp. PMI_506]|nr:hypothetical protein BX600DRAFT_556236 [Xylariales sp. PMI_506]
MKCLIPLLWLFGLIIGTSSVNINFPPSTDNLPMDLHPVVPVGSTSPSWWKRYPVNGDDQIKSLDDLYVIANKFYNWARMQPNCLTTSTSSLLVAAVYVPAAKEVVAATIPRHQKLYNTMKNALISRFAAPVWWSRAMTFEFANAESEKSSSLLHAEDLAYYMMEVTNVFPKQYLDGINDYDPIKYGDGTANSVMLAVWGAKKADPASLATNPGRPINLCAYNAAAINGRRISCASMAKNLGVYFEVVDEEPTADAAQDNDESTVSETNPGAAPAVCLAVAEPPPSKRWNLRGQGAVGARDDDGSPTVVAASGCTGPSTVTFTAVSSFPLSAAAETTSQRATITTAPAAKPSCYLQDESPGLGVTSPYCVCDGTITLPELSLPTGAIVTQSCDYTTLPRLTKDPVTISTSTWTMGCTVFSGVGGIEVAADATCTSSIPGCKATAVSATPSHAVLLSDTTISVGNLDDTNDGADLRKELFGKIQALCPDTGSKCTEGGSFDLENVPTIVDDGIEYYNLKWTIKGSLYDDADQRDRLIAMAVAGWERSTSQACNETDYMAEEDETGSGCGTGPLGRRGLPMGKLVDSGYGNETGLERRICDGCPPPAPAECHYKVMMCTGPDLITPIIGNATTPYANNMQILLEIDKGNANPFVEWLCEMITESLEEAAAAVAPELVPAEIMEDWDFNTMCGELFS